MAAAAKQQDLPPEGGYRPINYARIPAKKYFGGKMFLLS
jgi:NADH dehydrogenase (ubiquinone) 1 alpha subcomplex subunit 13